MTGRGRSIQRTTTLLFLKTLTSIISREYQILVVVVFLGAVAAGGGAGAAMAIAVASAFPDNCLEDQEGEEDEE